MSERRPLRIVVGVDFSEEADRAIDAAVSLASAVGGGEIHPVYVAPIPFASSTTLGLGQGSVWPGVDLAAAPATFRAVCDQTGRMLESVEQRCQSRLGTSGASVHGHICNGKTSSQIVRIAADVHADLVVVGTHGRRGLERLIFGSVAEQVVRKAPCPVYVARAELASSRSKTLRT